MKSSKTTTALDLKAPTETNLHLNLDKKTAAVLAYLIDQTLSWDTLASEGYGHTFDPQPFTLR